MKALDGLVVVALEQAVAAPLCSCRLADAGARVIKIERAEGDFARGYDTAAQGQSSYFVWLNHGKESIVLDFKQPDDAAFLRRLIDHADIFIENLAPGAAARAGFGAAELRLRNPSLITCSISGFGQNGPSHARKAYDLLIQAEAGLAAVTGPAEAASRVGVSISDITAGLNAYSAILLALLKKNRTGEGSEIAISLFDSTAELMTVPLIHFDYGLGAPAREGMRHPSIAPYGLFKVADGGEVLIAIQNEREWQRFCIAILGDAGLATDGRFSRNDDRVRNREILERIISDVFARLDKAHLVETLMSEQIAFGLLNSLSDLSAHPHLRRISISTETGQLEIPAPPAIFAEEYFSLRRVPDIGEHTEAIRREFTDDWHNAQSSSLDRPVP